MSEEEEEPNFDVLEPRDAPFEYYGGTLPDGLENRISNDTAYGSLLRPAKLPPLSSSKVSKFSDETVKERYLRAYNEGDFLVSWNNREHPLKLCLLVYPGYEGQDSNPAATVGLICINVTVGVRRQGGDTTDEMGIVLTHCECGEDTSFYNSLSPSQATAFTFRILHHFLRSRGASLEPVLSLVVSMHLYGHYTDKKRWEHALDIAMVSADLGINIYQEHELREGRLLAYVGEMLASLDRFQEAADIFEESAVGYARMDDSHSQIRCLEECSLAHKKAGNFVSAESVLVRALFMKKQDLGTTWNINHESTYGMLLRMTRLYYEWAFAHAGVNDDRDPGRVGFVLSALLFTAGYEPRDRIAYVLITKQGERTQKFLKPSFCSANQAGKALTSAGMAGPDTEQFRTKLLACANSSLRHGHVNISEKLIGFIENEDKKSGPRRFVSKEKSRFAVDSVVCENTECKRVGKKPGNGDGSLSMCPCKTAFYCDDKCQIADWKRHKKTCSHHARKKKEKEEAASTCESID